MTDQKTLDASSASLLNDGFAAVHCPNCPDRGFYIIQNRHTGEPEQVQCMFCDITPNSVFNIEAANVELKCAQMTDQKTPDASSVSLLSIGLEREQIMWKWDSWREYIASGGTASWPRDDFECLIDAYEEVISDLRESTK